MKKNFKIKRLMSIGLALVMFFAIAVFTTACDFEDRLEGAVDIRINIDNVRTRYSLGDSLDLSGLVVSAVLEDGSLRELRQNRDFTIDTSEYYALEEGVSHLARIRISAGEFRANLFVSIGLEGIEWPIWDGDIFYKNNGEYYWCDRIIEILSASSAFPLTADDFRMLDNVLSVDFWGGHPFSNEHILTINNKGRQNVLDTIRELERLSRLGRFDFASFQPRSILRHEKFE